MALWKVAVDGQRRWARGPLSSGPATFLPDDTSLDRLLGAPSTSLPDVLEAPAGEEVPPDAQLLAPLDSQTVWAAGVTYVRSRDARKEEAAAPDHYDKVYEADRPELFFKAEARQVRGSGAAIAVRSDSTWDVPEPELALVVDRNGAVVAYAIGNDVSSRSIEGENPLYLPQAKIYTGSCAIGPCVVPCGEAPPLRDMEITLEIERTGSTIFSGTVPVSDMSRGTEELTGWLFAGLDFPHGVVLLTGTSIVPEPEFTLRAADRVTITITGLGALSNHVEILDTGRSAA